MKKKLNRIAALLAGAALLFGALSCSSSSGGGGESGPGNTPSSDTNISIVLKAEPASIKVGETATVTSNIEGVKFASDDSTVATVDSSTGVVKGVKAGKVTIIATKDSSGGKTYSAGKVEITVTAEAEEGKVTVVTVADGTADTGKEYSLSELSSLSSGLPEGAVVYSDSAYTTVVEDVSSVKAGDTIYVVYITQNQYLSGKGNNSWDKVNYDFSKYTDISSISISLTNVKGTKTTTDENWWFCYGAKAWIGNLAWSDDISGYSAAVTKAEDIASIVENGLYVYGNVFGSGNIKIDVTEKVAVASVEVSGDSSVKTGLTITLNAKVLPENASDSEVKWSSSDTSVATVSDAGVVTGVKAGEAEITAEAGGVSSAAFKVTVTENTAKLTKIEKAADPSKTTYNVGDELSLEGLSFTLTYDDNNTGTVSYTAENTGFAVSGFDSSKAAASQEVTVTYTVGEVSGTAKFTVKIVQPVTKITISGDTTVKVASSITLKAAVEPSDATDSAVKWSSNDTSVATVSDAGVVTGAAVGTAVITAEAADGSGVKGTYSVSVTAQTGDLVITID